MRPLLAGLATTGLLSVAPVVLAAVPASQPATQPAISQAATTDAAPASTGSQRSASVTTSAHTRSKAVDRPETLRNTAKQAGSTDRNGQARPAKTIALALPLMDNRAYVVMDDASGRILAQKAPNQPLPPASLTKLMTSYLVEQALIQGKLREQDQATISAQAYCADKPIQSCMMTRLGSQVTIIDLLRGLIIHSGNDAAVALAERTSGSEAAFVGLMNQRARELGMKHTHFANPTGLGDSLHRSTALDLALLSRQIVRHAGRYYPLYGQRQFTYNNITQNSRNLLLASDPTVDGLKTGYTRAARYCQAVSARRDNRRLIVVILGASTAAERARQARLLLDWGFAHYRKRRLDPASQLRSVNLPAGWRLAPARPFELTLHAAELPQLQWNYTIRTPFALQAGQPVGEIRLAAGQQVLQKTPLLLQRIPAGTG